MTLVKSKAEVPATVEPKENIKMEVVKPTKPTADERIKRSEQFVILSQRYAQLSEKRNGLEKFLIADDGTQNCSMVLKSGNKTFEINNNGVIKDLLIGAKFKLNSLIEVTEAEILHFVI